MIADFSDFEQRVLLAVCNADPCSEAALAQLKTALVMSRKDTGCGVFVQFQTDGNNTKIKSDDRIMPGSRKILLEHPKMEHGADVIVWLVDGLMDCLEMVTFGEADWPKSEDLFEISIYSGK